jgi:predicted restriction endonuclease
MLNSNDKYNNDNDEEDDITDRTRFRSVNNCNSDNMSKYTVCNNSNLTIKVKNENLDDEINKNSNNKNSITYECTQKTEDRYIAIKNILSDAFSTNNIAEKLDKWCKICGSFHTDKVSEQHIDMESRFMIDPHIGSECKTTFARFLITHPLYDPRLLLYIISFAGVNTKSQPTYHYRSEIFTFMKLIEFYYAAYTLDAISAPPQQPPQPPQ